MLSLRPKVNKNIFGIVDTGLWTAIQTTKVLCFNIRFGYMRYIYIYYNIFNFWVFLFCAEIFIIKESSSPVRFVVFYITVKSELLLHSLYFHWSITMYQ